MNTEYKKRVNSAVDYISRNLDRNLSLEEIAETACFSKYHFHRIFKTVTGETVSACVRRLRLETAANRLLTDPGETITAIAMDCGFGSSQNFATVFKKHFGHSPGAFRSSFSLESWREKSEPVPQADGPENPPLKMWVTVEEMPAYHMVYKRITGGYAHQDYEQLFNDFYTWAWERYDSSTSMPLGVIWDNPDVTPPDQCRYDLGITVPQIVPPEGEMGCQTLAGGKYCVGHCEVSSYGELERIYDAIYSQWFPDSGYVPGNSVMYEIYLNHPFLHPRQSLLVDICIPLARI